MSDYPMLISNKSHSFRNFDGTKLQNNTEEKSYIPFKFEHKSIISLLLTQIKPYF